MAKLKKYQLVNTEGLAGLVVDDRMIYFESMTEQQAEKLFAAGCHYIKKTEATPLPEPSASKN